MIIKKIHIDGFGIFRDFSLEDLGKGVNILWGKNEAGKSTLLDFLRYTLFGYPRTRADHREPLNGGRHGGRIVTLAGDPAREVTFERWAGAKGGQIKLVTPDGESSDPAEWNRLLGGASGELYQNVYAFSLDELVSMDSLSRSGVEDRIYSIGLGLGDLSLGDVERGFQEVSDNIYSPRGRTQEVPRLMDRIGQLNEKLARIQAHLPAYQDLTVEIRDLEKATTGLGRALQDHNGEKIKLENFLRCHPYFVRIKRAGQELSDLPPPRELPAEGTRRLDEMERLERTLQEQARVLADGKGERKGIGALEQEIGAIEFNGGLLERAETVDYLRENRTLYKQEVKNREADLRRAGELDEQARNGISAIGSGWTEAHISGFEDMEGKRAKLLAFKGAYEQLNQEKSRLDTELQVLRSKESPLNLKAAAILLAAVAVVAAGAAFYYGLYIGGATLALIAVILYFGRGRLSRKGAYQLALDHLSELKTKEGALQQELGDYLASGLQLNRALGPEAALDVLVRVEQLRGMLAERDRLLQAMKENRDPFISGFERQANEARALLEVGLPEGDAESNVEILVNRIIGAFDAAKDLSLKKKQLEGELGRSKRELQATEKELKEVHRQIGLLLDGVGAGDRESFRDMYDKNEQVKALKQQVREATEAMENIAGLGKADEVVAYLETHEKAAIEQQVRELADEAETASAELQQMREDLGRKKQLIHDLEGESDLAETMTELETEKEKLQLAWRGWLTNQLALKILGDVKARFEQEKQPEVVRYASRYFREITGNRYEAIRVSLGQKEVGVFDPRGVARGIGQLSRGTREQLLVSLRLGFIEAYEKKTEALPIIVDEILVNFDSQRAQKTAEILEAFAKDRQILMLTCHETTAAFFKTPTVFQIG
jgi:uncharacterized protein YhaN